jgi:class 3 adenylate cyclase
MRTENLAVMLTDMKGYTAATSRQSREENARMLALHDELVLPVIRAFGGRRVKTMGDANLVLFGSPTSGLLCGMAIQDRLWDHARRVSDEERIEVRVVLSLGEVRLEGGGAVPSDVYGEAVNLAARVEEEAEAGQVWFTEAVRLVADRTQVAAEEVGPRRLKGIDEEVRLFRVPFATQRGDRAPYGNAALGRVVGLAGPEPERLARAIRRRGNPIFRAGRALAEVAAVVPLRPALAALLLAGAGLGAWWYVASGTERLIARGAFEEAAAAIDARAAAKGEEEPRVLYLRGRLAAGRAEAGQGGSLHQAFTLWSRALAAGSGDALDALREAAGSWECDRRRLAARALADSGSREALGPLEDLAEAEPPPADAVERVKRFFRAGGSCGAGDIARDGIREIEAAER